MMYLIAESGSTKTDWLLFNKDSVKSFETEGYNPQVMSVKAIVASLKKNIAIDILSQPIQEIYFYGAGCSSKQAKEHIYNALNNSFQVENIQVESDLLAACRATVGVNQGLVGILGTGSNFGFFDGFNFSQKTTNLGYLMGDEGSGNDIARRVIKKCLYFEISPEVAEDILQIQPESYNTFVASLYQKVKVNRYFASFMPRIHQYVEVPQIKNCISASLNAFIANHVSKYKDCKEVYLVGSIAYLYQDLLKELLEEKGYELIEIVRKPILGLLEYHRSEENY